METMNRFPVIIGKAYSAIRRGGIVGGGRRIAVAIGEFFRFVGSGDILFIASGTGDSARYRCRHIAEALRFRGFKTAVATQDNVFLSKYIDKFSIVVFHRVSWTPKIEKLLNALCERKKTVLFDTDDLIFDADLFKKTAAYGAMNALERKQYDTGVGKEFLRHPAIAAFSTSTAFLADRLRPFGKPVFVVPNRLSEEDVKNAERLRELGTRNKELGNREKELGMRNKESGKGTPRAVIIGYFSGSTGHDRDFGTVANVLAEVLEAHSNVRLFIAGPLMFSGALEKVRDRIVRVSYVSRPKHFKNLAHIDITIAPLEIGDLFCEAKSELKFFEAGLVGVPTVATATRTFREAIHDGVDGFVAMNESEWREKLERLILDIDLRKRMGERARETALERYSTKTARDDEYVNFLKERV